MANYLFVIHIILLGNLIDVMFLVCDLYFMLCLLVCEKSIYQKKIKVYMIH